MKLYSFFGLTLIALSACATVDGGIQDTARTQSDVRSSEGEISPKPLEVGDCGTFVWSGSAERKFVLFSDSRRNLASVYHKDQEVSLVIVDESESNLYGQSPQTSFQGPNGLSVELALSDYEDISSGRRYKSGTLSVTDDTGWEEVSPVVGLSSCQPAT